MAFRLLALSFIFLSSAAHANGLHYPKLFFQYSFLYDSICAGNNPVDPAWAREATGRESEFSALWESEAPALFGKLFADFGRDFSRSEMTATLSVCPKAPSFSNPLVLNVTRFLRSYMKELPVKPNHAFVDLVFHELLHTWLVENFSHKESALLKKYQNELPGVLSHIHLMALQIHVYRGLGRADLLDWIHSYYNSLPNPAYLRAWQIVRDEGYETFIAELKSGSKR